MLFSLLCTNIHAQKGNNSISLTGEVAIPSLQNENGFGFSVKGAYGIGRSAQLTLSGGYSRFTSTGTDKSNEVKTRLVPFLFGYKQHLQKFFIEPRVGIGELGGKISSGGDYIKPSVAALFGGVTAGYSLKSLSFGINFLTARGIESSDAGVWYNKDFHYTSVFVSYDLFRKSKR